MSAKKILVTAATGNIGRAVIADLNARGADFRASSRDTSEVDTPDAVRVDFADRDSVDAALQGIEVVFLNSGQHPDMEQLQSNVVQAARDAGVGHIVKVSGGAALMGADSASWVGRAHTAVEQRIRESGLAFTFLRPNYFMQNLLNLATPIANGKLPVPLPDQRMAMVDARDIGAVAAAVLADPDSHAGQVYDVTGPEAVSFAEVADALSDRTGSQVQHIAPPVDAAVQQLAANGAPDWLQQHFREIMGIFATDPRMSEVSGVVQRVADRAPRTVGEFIDDHAGVFSPAAAVS